MKTGRSLSDLVAEIERQDSTKKDYVANRSKLTMEVRQKIADDGKVTFNTVLDVPINGHSEAYPIRQLAHQQIGTITEIPAAYYNRMLQEKPGLLVKNVNEWMQASPKKSMVRLLDGNVRALLSDRYQRIDNYDVMAAILPEIQNLSEFNLKLVSADITETKLYLKMISPKVTGEILKGDAVEGGFIISNSEVGQGNISVQPFVNRLVCTNGMIVSEYSQKRRHVGKQLEEGDMDLYADDTKQMDAKAFFLKIRDTIRGTLEQSKFDIILNKFREAQGIPIHMPEEVVELAAERFGFSESERKGIFENLLKGNNMSLWGLSNAITRAAEDSESYDRASQLELIGSKALELEPKLVSQRKSA